jgi:hypothetical protein
MMSDDFERPGASAQHATAIAAAVEAERLRIGAILGSDEAKGREILAQHFAFKTALSPDDAIAALAAAPVTVAAATTPLSAKQLLLDKYCPDPKIGADHNGGDGGYMTGSTPGAAPWSAIVDEVNSQSGLKPSR